MIVAAEAGIARVVEVGMLARRAQIQRPASRVSGPQDRETQQVGADRFEEAQEVTNHLVALRVVVGKVDAVVVGHDVAANLPGHKLEYAAQGDLARAGGRQRRQRRPHRLRQGTLGAEAVGHLHLQHRPGRTVAQEQVGQPGKHAGAVAFHHATVVGIHPRHPRPVVHTEVEIGDHLAAVSVNVCRARHAGAEDPGAGTAGAAQHIRHRELHVAIARIVRVRFAADVDDARRTAEARPCAADRAQVGAGECPNTHVAVVGLQAAGECIAQRFQRQRAQQCAAGVRTGFLGKYHGSVPSAGGSGTRCP